MHTAHLQSLRENAFSKAFSQLPLHKGAFVDGLFALGTGKTFVSGHNGGSKPPPYHPFFCGIVYQKRYVHTVFGKNESQIS